ncbi:ABC transporter ATP-binding protein [Roseateles sp. SL47]|uniref:ABC transporter ATP-binding protein n=1 Tax=Roseateles sp. SL47 TaxID=2995138 RepID=UPI0022703A86|nr:ABC transporter ATP-binding protein [Roseateles sp. SL47]WAC73587.1 ABC transporter ATP-binding protein [Roseateles sp. SL47]
MEGRWEAQLDVTDARLALGGRWVLEDVALTVARGESVVLLGPSGCGKTTLLRAIAGLQPLDSGHLHMAGREVGRLPPQARDIGMMFQHYALFPNLSVRENILFGMKARGMAPDAAQARLQTLLAMIDLQSLAGRLPAALSGGQRQRVALARALATQPRLLLMDEPFSALDEHFRLPLRRQFRQLQRSLDQSCLIVTHDREEAFELADRVAVMLNGRIAQCASPRDLWRAPASVAVADFLGVFNRFDATRLPGGWQRDRGHWLAPIEAMQVVAADAPWPEDALQLHGTLQAAYWGQQRVALEFMPSTGPAQACAGVMTAWCDHQATLPATGQTVRLAVPARALCWLPQ